MENAAAFERANAIRNGNGEHAEVINELRSGLQQVLTCVNDMLSRVDDEKFRTAVMQSSSVFLSISIPGREYSLIYHEAFHAVGTVLSAANDAEKKKLIDFQNFIKERYGFSWLSSEFSYDQKTIRIHGDGAGKQKNLLIQHLKEAFPTKMIMT